MKQQNQDTKVVIPQYENRVHFNKVTARVKVLIRQQNGSLQGVILLLQIATILYYLIAIIDSSTCEQHFVSVAD